MSTGTASRTRSLDDVDAPDALLDVRGLVKHFPSRAGLLGRSPGVVRAVDGVRFWLSRGETLGLVGESGSGKTTTGRTILRLVEPTAGTALFEGKDVFSMEDAALRAFRRKAQIVFQDPFGSLNPRMTAGSAIAEVLTVHGLARADRIGVRVRDLLDLVGLSERDAGRYPHEFSGGQRQRIGIARALALEPRFIVCDEPVSALDVSVQAQVLNLLRDLQRDLGLTYLFIAHDLSVVEHMSDRVAVMYQGRIVETGDVAAVVGSPVHPYTRALLSAVPAPWRDGPVTGRGDVGREAHSRSAPESGCPFYTRCGHPRKDGECQSTVPPLAEKSPNHFAACIKEPAATSLDTPERHS